MARPGRATRRWSMHMPELIKNGRLIADRFISVDADAPLPDGPLIVPLARWQAQREALLARGQALGVQVANTTAAAELAADLPHLAVVAIEFPKFADGRGYTLARLLRERFAYTGEIRAVGAVLRDQLFFMARVGFDAFALREDQDAEAALQAFSEFSVRYQPAADEPLPLYRRR